MLQKCLSTVGLSCCVSKYWWPILLQRYSSTGDIYCCRGIQALFQRVGVGVECVLATKTSVKTTTPAPHITSFNTTASKPQLTSFDTTVPTPQMKSFITATAKQQMTLLTNEPPNYKCWCGHLPLRRPKHKWIVFTLDQISVLMILGNGCVSFLSKFRTENKPYPQNIAVSPSSCS